MPKFYYPSPDELQGATPLNELLWFPRMQSQLLRLANTNEGRDLLCIDSWQQQPYPIIKMGKNFVRFDMGYENGRRIFKTDVRVGAKWGNVIRSRWQEVKKAIDRTILESILAYPPVYYRGQVLHPVGGAATTTAYPDPHPESTTVDGRTGHRGETAAWSVVVAGAGNESNDSITNDTCVYAEARSASPNWEGIRRGMFLFDTSGTAGDNIDSAIMSIEGRGKVDTAGIAMALNVYTSNPASNTAVADGDHDAYGTTDLSADITYANYSTSGYNDWTLNTAGLAVISTTITKLAVYDSVYDAPDNTPTHPGAFGYTQFTNNFAESSGTTSDPKLVIVHSSPFTPNAIMF